MYTQGYGRNPEIFAVESKAWNSKSKTVLDSLAWSDWRDFTLSYHQQIVRSFISCLFLLVT